MKEFIYKGLAGLIIIGVVIAVKFGVFYGTQEQQRITGFIKQYGGITAVNEEGETLLHIAVLLVDKEFGIAVAKHLISKGADVNAKNKKGDTPLHYAARLVSTDPESEKFYDFLVAVGADVNAKDNGGRTPTQLVEVQAELDELRKHHAYGEPLFHAAAVHGSLAVVEYLVSEGHCPNERNTFGDTSLRRAVTHNENLEVVKFLFSISESGTHNRDSDTLLHAAASNQNVEVIKFIASKGQDRNVNAKDLHGRTPLNLIGPGGNVEVARFLVSLGADVNARTNEGWTPLHSASLATFRGKNNIELVKFLVSQGADVNARTNEGKTPLDMARRYAELTGNTDIVQYLESEGAR